MLPAEEAVVEGKGEIPLELDLAEEPEFPDFGWQETTGLGTAAEAGKPAGGAEIAETEGLGDVEEAEEIEAVEELELHDDLADLSKALEELALEEEPAELPVEAELLPVPPAQPLRGWEEIFPQAAPGDAIDLGELESHYDLGVGYKEMGMYGKAIQEFELAAGNPQRRLDCLTLQAVCFREKGEPEKAQDLLQRGRELDVLSSEERVTICYELGYHYESQGASQEAIELYREVHLSDPTFHDVAERLSALTGEESLDFIDLEEAEVQ
jgi:tetratricopeptide (TPR) repeat protein